MSNLAPARRAKATYFTDGVMREVVVKQEPALHFTLLDIIHKLFVFLGAQSGGNERLSFTASEKRGAVDARQPTNLAAYRADFREPAAIRPAPAIENVVAKEGFFQMIENFFGHLSLFRFVLRITFDDFLFQSVNCRVTIALLLAGSVDRKSTRLNSSHVKISYA